MFCPTCGLKQSSEQTRFCSRCGFLLTGVSEVIANGGVATQNYYTYANGKSEVSIRKKGLKRGGKMLFAGMILVPLLGILTEIFRLDGAIVGLTAIITFWGGILRMFYALIFEGNETEMVEQKLLRFYRKVFRKENTLGQLPSPQSIPVSDFSDGRQGMWRETADLRHNSQNL